MAKRLKTLNLCDASIERMQRYQGGQSAFARLAILEYDRLKHLKYDTLRELEQQNSLLDMNRHNYATLVDLIIDAYDSGWSVKGLLMHILDKDGQEIAQIHDDGYLKTGIRMEVSRLAMNGDGSLA